MMPLTFADNDAVNIIRRVGGSPEVKKHLENLGFVVGGNQPSGRERDRKREGVPHCNQ